MQRHIFYVLMVCLSFLSSVNGQGYTYTFEAPVFTTNETTPILTRLPNAGGNDFTTSFTSSPTSTGFNISSFIQAPLSGNSLRDIGSVDNLTLSFSRPVSAITFNSVIGVLATAPAGRVHLDWGTGSQDFASAPFLPGNFQVSSPNFTFPSNISSLQVTAFDNSNTQVFLFMDNLTLTAVAVPEPTTWALMGVTFSAAGYLFVRSRRSKRQMMDSELLLEES